jgi:hypothetical protein
MPVTGEPQTREVFIQELVSLCREFTMRLEDVTDEVNERLELPA